jgi:serine/threonine-protein kinase
VQLEFEAIVEIDCKSREVALEVLRSKEPALAATVAGLLEADAAPSILDASVTDLAEEALRYDHVGALVKTQIGPYRLVRLLGEGGMGSVFLAERQHLGGHVAIKLLRDAWMSPMRSERFRREQRTLALLNHPNIAQIHDAGILSEDTPWFVMEYVDGVPLTEWAMSHHAGLQERLALIKQVAGAVSCAHDRMLVHRDLKPSNILVTSAGEVKLLDFGIVKDLASTSERQTIDGMQPLTPGYAAPEQLTSGDVGLFTDIYGLGVLLYEMLTSELPQLDAEGFASKPSRHAATNKTLQLSRAQWNDLDAVCERALQPNSAERYKSADAFLQDLVAFEEGRVLVARASGRLDALCKFVRRNQLVLSVATVAAMLLAGSTAVSFVRVTRSRDLALRQLNRMGRLQRFTESLFDGGTPGQGRSAQVTTDMLLRRGELQAEGLHDDPELQSAMFATLGGTWRHLGDLPHASVLLERALEQRDPVRRQLPHDADSRALYAESEVDLGLLRLDQRRMSEAEEVLRKAVAQMSERGRLAPEAGRALSVLGDALATDGKYVEAQSMLDRALVVEQRAGKTDTQEYADALARLGDVQFYLGHYPQAESLNRRSLEIYLRTAGQTHPSVAHVTNTLGQIAFDQGKFTEAESDFRQALALDERWYGMENAVVGDDLSALARVYSHTSRDAEAKTTMQHALQIQERVHTHRHTAVATILNELGDMAYNHDQDDEAERYFREALAIWLSLYGERHQFVGLSYANLTGVYMDRKDYTRAEEMARKAIAVDLQTLPPEHPSIAFLHVKLGRILLREGRYSEAEPETRQGYEFLLTHGSSEASYLKGARKDLTAIYTALRRPDQLAALK